VHQRRYSTPFSLSALSMALAFWQAAATASLLLPRRPRGRVGPTRPTFLGAPLTRRVGPTVPRRMPPREPGAPRRGGGQSGGRKQTSRGRDQPGKLRAACLPRRGVRPPRRRTDEVDATRGAAARASAAGAGQPAAVRVRASSYSSAAAGSWGRPEVGTCAALVVASSDMGWDGRRRRAPSASSADPRRSSSARSARARPGSTGTWWGLV